MIIQILDWRNTGNFEVERLMEYYNSQVIELLQGSVEQMFCEAEGQDILNECLLRSVTTGRYRPIVIVIIIVKNSCLGS